MTTTGTRLRTVLPVPFTPLQLSGLHTWFKAEGLGLADGAAVSSWTDGSGNGHTATQATGAAQPTYKTGIFNGRPVVRFDGGDQLVTAAWTGLTQPTTYVAVVKASTPSRIVGSINPAAEHILYSVGTVWRIYAGGAEISGGTFNTNAHVFSSQFNGASSVGRLDGTQILAGNAGANQSTGVTLGANFDGALKLTGDIAEFLIYNPGLSLGNLQTLERHLGAKYGISVA